MTPLLPERKKVQLKPNYRLFLVLDSFKGTFLFLGQFGNDFITYSWKMDILRAIIGYVSVSFS